MTTRMTKTMKVMITPHLGRLGSSRYLRHLPPSPRRNPDFHLIHDVGGMKLLVGIPHSLQARGAGVRDDEAGRPGHSARLGARCPRAAKRPGGTKDFSASPRFSVSTTLGTPDQPC